MEKICFTIVGNQLEPKGNAIPYTRTTQRQKWTPKYQRYNGWKGWVRAAYLDAKYPDKVIKREDFGDAHQVLQEHPIGGKPRGTLVASIYFADETHPDPDNVAKGILDAMFESDKEMDVQTYHECRSDRPRVEVLIKFD